MATKGLIGAAAAAVFAGLLGCNPNAFPPPPPGSRADCKGGGNCTVVIHLDVCTYTVVPKILDVYGENNIFWELDKATQDAGYHFPELIEHHGILIKKDPTHQFGQPERQNDWKFKLHDKNNDEGKGSFDYAIQVIKGSIPCDLDPTIVNH